MTSPGPRSGDDTYDLIDDALAELARRRGAWLGDDLTAITLLASLIDQAERCLPELVTSARLNGHTWEQVATALATSPDEARLRFDPQSPVADSRWPYDDLPKVLLRRQVRPGARLSRWQISQGSTCTRPASCTGISRYPMLCGHSSGVRRWLAGAGQPARNRPADD